jgi:hypothetical protein
VVHLSFWVGFLEQRGGQYFPFLLRTGIKRLNNIKMKEAAPRLLKFQVKIINQIPLCHPADDELIVSFLSVAEFPPFGRDPSDGCCVSISVFSLRPPFFCGATGTSSPFVDDDIIITPAADDSRAQQVRNK